MGLEGRKGQRREREGPTVVGAGTPPSWAPAAMESITWDEGVLARSGIGFVQLGFADGELLRDQLPARVEGRSKPNGHERAGLVHFRAPWAQLSREGCGGAAASQQQALPVLQSRGPGRSSESCLGRHAWLVPHFLPRNP